MREIGGDNYSYANDYQIITRLKALADNYSICLLLVHHTRKQQSDDKFDMISGTNGLLGAADGAFLLTKEIRTSNAACLDVSGRDQPDQRLHLFRNEETLAWELERVETELWKAPPEPLLEQISAFLSSDGKEWFHACISFLLRIIPTSKTPNRIRQPDNTCDTRTPGIR